MELVAAGLGHHVDGRAGEAAVFGLRSESDDSHFFNGVVVDVHQRAERSRFGIGRVDAVDQKHVLVGRTAVRGRAGQRLRAGPFGHAGGGQREIVESIAGGRKFGQQFLVDSRIDGRALDIDDGRFTGDRDRLLHRADREDQVQRGGGVGTDSDVFAHDGFESAERCRDRVAAGRQIQKDVAARGGRDGGPRARHQRRAGDFNSRPWDGRAIVADDRAGELAFVDGLRVKRRRGECREENRDARYGGEVSGGVHRHQSLRSHGRVVDRTSICLSVAVVKRHFQRRLARHVRAGGDTDKMRAIRTR